MKPTTLCTLLAAAGTPISSAFRIVTYRGGDCHGAVMNSFSVSSASLVGGCSEAINTEASSATIQPEYGDGERDGMYSTHVTLPKVTLGLPSRLEVPYGDEQAAYITLLYTVAVWAFTQGCWPPNLVNPVFSRVRSGCRNFARGRKFVGVSRIF